MSSQAERPHIVVLIDNSGSMDGKQAAVAASFNALADAVRDFNYCPDLSLGFFQYSCIFRFRKVTADKFPPLLAEDIHPDNGTDLFNALKKTAATLAKEKPAPTLILVITDGETFSQGFEAMAQQIREARTKAPLEIAIIGPTPTATPTARSSVCQLTLCQLTDAGSQLYMDFGKLTAFQQMATITADALARWVKRASQPTPLLSGKNFFNESSDEALYVNATTTKQQRPLCLSSGEDQDWWDSFFGSRNNDRRLTKPPLPELVVPKLLAGDPCPYLHGLYMP